MHHSKIFLRLRETRWRSFLLIMALSPALALMNSCGSSSTTAAPFISVTGEFANVNAGGASVQFTVTVANLSSTLVNWQVNSVNSPGPPCTNPTTSTTCYGSIDSNGLYTPPITQPTNNIVTITAVAQANTSVSASTMITIEGVAAIAGITPNGATLAAGLSQAFTATVTGGLSTAATWYVNSSPTCTVASSTVTAIPTAAVKGGNSTLGTITPTGGNYTAPQIPPPGGVVTIYAVSVSNTTQFFCVPVTATFGNASLQNSYAFSTRGRLIATNTFFGRAGSLTASCTAGCTQGTLTGIEDTNQGGIVTTQRAFTGTFVIGPDGRGTMQFCENNPQSCSTAGATSFFRIVVVSATQAQIIDFSQPNTSSAVFTSSGEMDFQDQSIFGNGNSNLQGAYSFNFTGVSSASTEESVVGDFYANGGLILAGASGTIPGSMDINAGGAQTLPQTAYSILSNGRGTATIGSLHFSFYVVSSSRAKFIEIDASPASVLVGDAFQQQTAATCPWGLSTLNGVKVFETAGAASGAGIADLGSFTASNNGTTGSVSAASIDENNGGMVSPPLGTLSGNYTVDSCGRGTLAIGSHSYVFYIISAASALLQETTSGVVGHGLIVASPQGATFGIGLTNVSYALSLAGTNAAGTAGMRDDLVGELITNSSGAAGAVTGGTLDINSFGATQSGVAITGGPYPLVQAPAGSLRGTLSLTPARSLVLYQVGVSPTQFFVLDTDTTGTASGSLYDQF